MRKGLETTLSNITKNDKGDLAVMSIEIPEKLEGKYELYKLLNEGIDAMENKKTKSFEQVIEDIEKELE